MQKKITRAAAAAFLAAKKPAAFKNRAFDVSMILSSDAEIKKLNKFWRGKNKPTNVLSFPQIDLSSSPPSALRFFPAKKTVPLGDVVLALQTIRKEAKTQSKSLENHVIHLTVHGILHLLGYDHMTSKEAKSMEKLECDILESLGYPDPYHAADD